MWGNTLPSLPLSAYSVGSIERGKEFERQGHCPLKGSKIETAQIIT